MTITTIQRALRRAGIGGSDAAPATNMSRWKSPLRLWQEKVGEAQPEPGDNEYQHFGRLLENVVADEFSRRRGLKLRRVNQTLRHRTFDWMLGHIDRRVVGAQEGFEAKTTSLRMAKEWGEQDTDKVPDEVLVQDMHYLAVTGWQAWHTAVLIAGNDFRVYRVERDEEMIEALYISEQAFWKCVVTRTPPDPVNLDDAASLWPRDNGKWLTAPIAIANECVKLDQVQRQIKRLQAAGAEHELAIKRCMESNTTLLADATHRLATWKEETRKNIDVKLLREKYPDIAQECTRVQKSRVFRLQ